MLVRALAQPQASHQQPKAACSATSWRSAGVRDGLPRRQQLLLSLHAEGSPSPPLVELQPRSRAALALGPPLWPVHPAHGHSVCHVPVDDGSESQVSKRSFAMAVATARFSRASLHRCRRPAPQIMVVVVVCQRRFHVLDLFHRGEVVLQSSCRNHALHPLEFTCRVPGASELHRTRFVPGEGRGEKNAAAAATHAELGGGPCSSAASLRRPFA